MAKQTKDSNKTTVVAELTITSPLGKEVVRSFDTAWHRSLDIAREGYLPVNVKFNDFVRKD